MKGLLVILLCCIVLSGCGNEQANEQQTDKQQTVSKTEEIIYNADELVQIDLNEIQFQIPASWNADVKKNGDFTYYYYDDLMFTTQCVSTQYTNEGLLSDINGVANGVKSGFDECEEMQTDIINISGKDILEISAIAKIKGEIRKANFLVFIYNRNQYSLSLVADDKKDYSEEYKSLKDSIIIPNTIQESQSIEENTQILKDKIIESAKDAPGGNADFLVWTDPMFAYVFDVKNLTKDTFMQSEEYRDFLLGAAYLYTHFEEGSVGNEIGRVALSTLDCLALSQGDIDEIIDYLAVLCRKAGFAVYKTQYTEGQYKIGADIPAGEYVVFTNSGQGYFSLTSDANGKDIIANENFKYNSIIQIDEGEYLNLKGCFAVPIDEVTDLPIDKADMLKIGVHLPAGEYKVVADNEKAYYCIYNDGKQEDIEANDNFSGQSYITIREGQYLKMSRCHIEE